MSARGNPRHSANTDEPQMLFTWDATDLCIVFRGWHVTSTLTLFLSLAAVILLTAGYEAVRDASRRYALSCSEHALKLTSKCLRLNLKTKTEIMSRRRRRRIRRTPLMYGLLREKGFTGKATAKDNSSSFVRSAGILQLLHYVSCLLGL